MKKKLEDMTIKEVMDLCDKHSEIKSCAKCPLQIKNICVEGNFCPASWFYIKKEIKEIEVELN